MILQLAALHSGRMNLLTYWPSRKRKMTLCELFEDTGVLIVVWVMCLMSSETNDYNQIHHHGSWWRLFSRERCVFVLPACATTQCALQCGSKHLPWVAANKCFCLKGNGDIKGLCIHLPVLAEEQDLDYNYLISENSIYQKKRGKQLFQSHKTKEEEDC